MPRVTWYSTWKQRAEAAAKEREDAGKCFFAWLDTARRLEELGVDAMLERAKLTKPCYYRRKKAPDTMTVQEIRELAKAVNLYALPEGREALLRMIGAA